MLRVIVGILLSATAALPLTAQSVVAAQNQGVPERITVAFDNTPLKEAIWAISKRSGIQIFFDENILPVKRVSYQGDNVTPATALSVILDGTGIQADRGESNAFRLVKARLKTVRAQSVITGKVTDSKTGKGISGASVSIGSDRVVVTTEDGTYKLAAVPAGTYTVTVRLVGYSKQTRSVTVGEAAILTVDFKLEQSANVLDQVVVTGTVVSTELKAIPNAITVITARQIEQRGLTSIEQLFRGEVPGLYAQNVVMEGTADAGYYGEVQMFSRGSSTVPKSSIDIARAVPTAIKTYVDGVELARSEYLSTIDPKSIERIEILTGPQASTIYGSDAINGVMQIFTKRAGSSTTRWSGTLSSGMIENSYNRSLTPQHDYTIQLTRGAPGFSYTAGAGYKYQGQWVTGRNSESENGFVSARLDVTGRVTAEPSFRITRRANGSGTSNPFPGTADRIQRGIITMNPIYFIPNDIKPRVFGQTMGVTTDIALWPAWHQQLIFGRDELSTGLTQVQKTYSAPFDTLLQVRRNASRRLTTKYSNTLSGGIAMLRGTLTSGMDYTTSSSDYYSIASSIITGTLAGGTPSLRRTDNHSEGYYGQGQLAAWETFFLTVGLRGEKNPNYGRDYGINVSPRYGASIVREIGSVTAKLRGAYGKATRPPTDGYRQERISTSTTYGGSYVSQLEAPNLRPEFQAGGEGGLEVYAGNRVNFTVTRYNQIVDDLIFSAVADSLLNLIPDANSVYGYTRQTRYINLGSVRNSGWEGQARVTLGRFSANGTWSNTKSRIRRLTNDYRCGFANTILCLHPGRSMLGFTEHTGALGITYTDGRSSVNAVASIVGQNPNYRDDDLISENSSLRRFRILATRMSVPELGFAFPAYYTMDITASHTLSSRVQLFTNVTNATNSFKAVNSSSQTVIGRVTMLGIRLR